MEILYFKDLGDTSVISKCSLGVNLVIDIFYVASGTSPSIKVNVILINATLYVYVFDEKAE